MLNLVKALLVLGLTSSLPAMAEWIEYYNPANKESAITYSTSSLKRVDEYHYSLKVFTNYAKPQLATINKQSVQFQSKTETQFFGCETQDFALGEYELYRDKDALGAKTVVTPKEILWNPVQPNSLQMDFLRKFCTRR